MSENRLDVPTFFLSITVLWNVRVAPTHPHRQRTSLTGVNIHLHQIWRCLAMALRHAPPALPSPPLSAWPQPHRCCGGLVLCARRLCQVVRRAAVGPEAVERQFSAGGDAVVGLARCVRRCRLWRRLRTRHRSSGPARVTERYHVLDRTAAVAAGGRQQRAGRPVAPPSIPTRTSGAGDRGARLVAIHFSSVSADSSVCSLLG